MSVKPVYLEDIPSIMTLEEVPKEVLVPNPGGRELVITPKESGWNEEQVFTSKCLPDIIPYELLGFIKFPDGSVYPKYRANVITDKELWLKGRTGYEKGMSIIDKVAWWLTYQEKMLEAKSIKQPDLEFFNYKEEILSYWLASPGSYHNDRYVDFGPGAVKVGVVDSGGCYAFGSYEYWSAIRMAVRPVMNLASKVQVDNQDDVTWVPL